MANSSPATMAGGRTRPARSAGSSAAGSPVSAPTAGITCSGASALADARTSSAALDGAGSASRSRRYRAVELGTDGQRVGQRCGPLSSSDTERPTSSRSTSGFPPLARTSADATAADGGSPAAAVRRRARSFVQPVQPHDRDPAQSR